MHVVLSARTHVLRAPANRKVISNLLFLYAEKYQVRVYQNSLNTNHCHLVLFCRDKIKLQNFLRVFAGQVAQRISGSKKGRALRVSFWMGIAWSRVVTWGRAFENLIKYVMKKQAETLGLIPYTPRSHRKKKE